VAAMSMYPSCRIIDSGLRSGALNDALDRMLLKICDQGRYTALLRFHQYRPTASLGAHEATCRAVRADYCRDKGIPIVRRFTGGEALYRDPGQLCWTLAMRREEERTLGEWMRFFAEATRDALRVLGIEPALAGANEFEVGERKIGTGFVAFGERSVLFQGTLLLDIDIETTLKVLRAPTEKLSTDGMLSARRRVITVQQILGQVPPLCDLQTIVADTLGARLHRSFLRMPGPHPGRTSDVARPSLMHELEVDWEAQNDSTLQAFVKTPGGILHACVRLDKTRVTIERLTIAGSVHMHPADLFVALQEWMGGVAVSEWETQLNSFFHVHACDGIGFTLHDIYRLIRLTLARTDQQQRFALTPAQANTLMLHTTGTAEEVLACASAMLVPYCAKPVHCKWRNRDGCPECGLCEVGDAYRLARERGMRVISVTNYEHLRSVLAELRADGTQAYVGMCCAHFYLKRQDAFREAGIPAVLMDITGSNCYELQEEDLAYAGKFMAQAHLNIDVVEKVMRFVPPSASGQIRHRRRKSASGEGAPTSDETARQGK
jgi:lipoate-protein ligase A